MDKRNLILHVLQGIGSVAGAVSGLTAFTDIMGPSVAIFNGSFIQGYVGIAPDHAGTQLNRLSDSAYITNTLVDKLRARTIAIFIPEGAILTNEEQNSYWKDPTGFLRSTLHLDQADVCVDGAFITTIAPPTLIAAVLTPKPPATTVAGGAVATLTVKGTNFSTTDTQVVGLGPTVLLTTASGTTGSVDLTMPTNYTAGAPVHLASAANPSVVSATIPTTIVLPPSLKTAVLTPKPPATTLAVGTLATLLVTGTNLNTIDTQVVGLGAPVTLTSAGTDGTSGSVDITLPANYAASMPVYLASAIVPSMVTGPISTASVLPLTLATAVLTPRAPSTSLVPGATAVLTVTGTNLSTSDTQVVGLGPTVLLTTVTGTTGTVNITLPTTYAAGMPVHLASVKAPSVVSLQVPTTP